jgi:putative FmdB family regulatory protein
MPIYEYRCAECESHFEKMQKISDEPLKVCEKCGGALEKQWSLSGFQFKGAGWYVTDYANKGKSESKTEAKSEGKSETKSEPKSEASNNSEKSSAGESTAKTESASNTTKSDVSTSKKE